MVNREIRKNEGKLHSFHFLPIASIVPIVSYFEFRICPFSLQADELATQWVQSATKEVLMPNYKVAIIGSTSRGNYGHDLDRVWLEIPGAKIVAVADDNKTGLDAELKKLKVADAKGYLDYRKMLDEEKPQYVSIGPRWPDRHAEMVIECANRGIHMYLEKPMCQTLKQADDMIAACRKTGVKVAIAFQTRYSPVLTVVKQLLDEGRIGDVLEFRSRGKEDKRGGGEDLWVLGSHLFNMIHHLGGEPEWCQARVFQGGKPVTKEHVKQGNEALGLLAGDEVHATWGLANGAIATFNSKANMGTNPTRFGIQIFGSKGIIEVLMGALPEASLLEDVSWSPARSGKTWVKVTSEGVGAAETIKETSLLSGNVRAVKDLITAVENDRQPEASIYEGKTTVEMIASVFESHRTGGTVMFPLKNRENPLGMMTG